MTGDGAMSTPHRRREFLLGAAACAGTLAAAELGRTGPALAQTKAPSPGTIDVHHHAAPPFYMEDLKLRGRVNPGYNGWTPERSLEDMDQAESRGRADLVQQCLGRRRPAGRAARARLQRLCGAHGAGP